MVEILSSSMVLIVEIPHDWLDGPVTTILWLAGILLARKRGRSTRAQIGFSIAMWTPVLAELFLWNGKAQGFEILGKAGVSGILVPAAVFVLFLAPSFMSLGKGKSTRN